ncbi:MAG: hypothetical protein ACQKBT_10565, partial [Puniceicoccales bacterium]
MWQIIFILWLLSQLAGFVALFHLLLSRKRTTSLVLWALWLLILPALGIPLYLTIGSDRIRRRSIPSHPVGEHQIDPDAPPSASEITALLQNVSQLSGNTLTRTAGIELLPNSTRYYPHLIASIDNARDFVHIQTYVFRMDPAGDQL